MWRASYARVQATVGVGTVLIWDIGVAETMGGGYQLAQLLSLYGKPPQGLLPSAVGRKGGGVVLGGGRSIGAGGVLCGTPVVQCCGAGYHVVRAPLTGPLKAPP